MRKRVVPVIIIILCIVTRLPQLCGHEQLLDGDECVEGLMAWHIYRHSDIPLFFYGQAYGFCLPECLVTACFYAVGGLTTLAVRYAMLAMWTAGVVLLYAAFVRMNNGKILLPLLLAVVFVCCPGWAIWSMAARGGYMTAFLLSGWILYILSGKDEKHSLLSWGLTGILMILAYEAQPIWIPGLLVYVIYSLCRERVIVNAAAFTAPAVLLFVLFHLYKLHLSHYYAPGYSFSASSVMPHLSGLPALLFASLHGHYFGTRIIKPDSFSMAFACAFSAVLLLLFIAAVINILVCRRHAVLFNLSVLAIAVTVLPAALFDEMQPRYLLPVAVYVLLSVLLFVAANRAWEKICIVTASLLVICGAVSVVNFKNFRYSTMQKRSFCSLLQFLRTNKVHYVYCYDYMLAWQLLFYSKEEIVARDRPLPGRYPQYAQRVDSAMAAGATTALIYNELQLRNMHLENVQAYKGFCIIINPPGDMLQGIFVLNK